VINFRSVLEIIFAFLSHFFDFNLLDIFMEMNTNFMSLNKSDNNYYDKFLYSINAYFTNYQ